VSIEDLLNRAPIRIERSAAAKEIYEKVVMITGAAGSIAAIIVRQVINLNPSNSYSLIRLKAQCMILNWK
jgi:FlaA1/EpsC-like NDP-sugar epimerase